MVLVESDTPLWQWLELLGEPIRARLLRFLDHQELSVAELQSALDLPQSTVSRHLRQLLLAEVIEVRREGTARYYRSLAVGARSSTFEQLWRVVQSELIKSELIRQDDERLNLVIRERQRASQIFFSESAASWEKLRAELFGADLDARLFAAAFAAHADIVELGCGTGRMLEHFARTAQSVIGVDQSQSMLATAAKRLGDFAHVQLVHSSFDELAAKESVLADSADRVFVSLLLHHVPEPSELFSSISRLLRPQGQVLLVDLLPHPHVEYRQQMGHLWLGFSQEQVASLALSAGLELKSFTELPSGGSGPSLFVAILQRSHHCVASN